MLSLQDSIHSYLATLLLIAVCTLLALLFRHLIDPVNMVMFYLVAVVFVGAKYGRTASIFASILSVTAFNFFFVEPYYSLQVYDSKYYVTFAFLLAASLIVSSVAAKLKLQSASVARQNEELQKLYQAANELANATKIAEDQSMEAERIKLRNTLLSAMGHDLRTPLSSITGAASTLCAQPNLSPQAEILAHSIHIEASRLNKLVSNLLDVTRMESGTLSLNRQPYFVDELIGSSLELTKESVEKHSVSLQVERDLPLLNIDGVLIEQVLINLLENAARYTLDGGNISVTASGTPYAVEISVADSGIGIPAGSEIAIFERYKRLADKKPTERGEGMGLGLAICKGIVEAHGGHIWVRNSTNGGAVFTFTLPFQFNKLALEDICIDNCNTLDNN